MAYVRPWGEGQYLITITAINRTNSNVKSSHSNCLFQTEIEINVENGFFNPYQSSPSLTNAKLETEIYREKALIDDLSSELLFSNYKSFAIGHNCSTNWKLIDNKVESIFANCFPIFETPSITPDITFADGNKVSISMQDLAELKNKSNTILSLQKIIDEYEIWIENQKANFQKDFSKIQFKKAFDSNLQDCLIAINKMRKGLNLLENNDLAFKAFTIANEAMYLQQARSKLPLRDTIIEKDGRFKVLGKYPIHIENNSIGTWRAFQIAYILSVIESIANPDSSEREVVDLIFFPTGGGKTEAYLGVIAFTIIYRRLINPEDSGTAVMMRYTLRLLTTQQFLRAASLICALELIRKNSNELLGSAEIAIGAWLGGSVTPNRRQDAIKALESMQKDIKKRPWKKDNPFLVLQN
jgi:hypothetical protein